MSYSFPILIASDHAGLDLKKKLITHKKQFNWKDVGCFTKDRTDYTDWAEKLCQSLKKNSMYGILICGTGQGMSIKANRYPNIRAGLCWNEQIAKLARAHNKINVLCLPGHYLSLKKASKIIDVFLETDFEKQTAYIRRIKKLTQIPF